MKKIFLFLLVGSISVFAQNPDGKNVSLHITPSWLWGKSDFQQITKLWYPPTQVSDEFFVTTHNYGIVDYPFAFGVNASVKIPATSFLTLSLAYSYNQKFEEDNGSNQLNKYFSQIHSVNGRYHTASITMSFYNLFSLYIE
ncbi:MAG: hypothetical protein ACOYNS_05395 [Bacteroidota bacterium]